MFDLKIKFETKVQVKAFDKEFEKMLNSCIGGPADIPCSIHTVEHTMTLTSTPIIPDKEWLANSEQIIFGEMSKSFATNNDINAVVLETKFVGFTEITQR